MTDQSKPDQQSAADQPANPARRRIFGAAAAVGLAGSLPTMAAATARPAKTVKGSLDAKLKAHIKTVVVIYLENRSFNNLFADFPGTAWPLSTSRRSRRGRWTATANPCRRCRKSGAAWCRDSKISAARTT